MRKREANDKAPRGGSKSVVKGREQTRNRVKSFSHCAVYRPLQVQHVLPRVTACAATKASEKQVHLSCSADREDLQLDKRQRSKLSFLSLSIQRPTPKIYSGSIHTTNSNSNNEVLISNLSSYGWQRCCFCPIAGFTCQVII